MKKALKIIIAVIVVVALVVGGIFAYKFISTGMAIKNTEEKLSQINAKELETKLIKELEKSKLNVNTSNVSTKICTWEEISKSKENEMFVMGAEIFYGANKQDNPYEKSISAYITSNSKETVAIPLFRIESDSNGNFKKIIYTEMALKEYYTVTDTIKKVLKDDYDINMFIEGNEKYNTRFNKIFNSKTSTIFATEKDLTKILNEIHNSNNSSYPKSYEEYSITEFGLEIN